MTYKNKFIHVQVVWFYENEAIDSNTDMIFYRQVKNKINSATEFYTLLIDLNKSEEEIFSGFSKQNRKEIRKSTLNDNLSYKMYHEDINEFLLNKFFNAHNRFTHERNLGNISQIQLEGYRNNNQLYISTISTENNIISWRVHVANKDRVRSFVSNSFFHNEDKNTKNLIGRASRVMRWQDILYFKEHHFQIYDFGGWYHGKKDKKRLTINQYKESFTKTTEQSYNYMKCITFKCYIFRFLAYIKNILLYFTSK